MGLMVAYGDAICEDAGQARCSLVQLEGEYKRATRTEKGKRERAATQKCKPAA